MRTNKCTRSTALVAALLGEVTWVSILTEMTGFYHTYTGASPSLQSWAPQFVSQEPRDFSDSPTKGTQKAPEAQNSSGVDDLIQAKREEQPLSYERSGSPGLMIFSTNRNGGMKACLADLT